jgi:alpha-tubulin suppressor-like RCC1 family protein
VSLRAQLSVVSLTAVTSIVACNAIVGVSDVTFSGDNVSTPFDGGGGGDQTDGGQDNNGFDATSPDDSGSQPMTDSGGGGPTALFEVSGGGFHSCAKASDGTVKCWGDNEYGQIGNGVTLPDGGPPPNVMTPTTVMSLGTGTLHIGGGYTHQCAIKSDKSVACWGLNSSGQITGSTTPDHTPTPQTVTGVSPAVAIGAGFYSTCAVLDTGAVKCWGDDSGGELGDGTKVASPPKPPVGVQGLTDAVSVSVGGLFACALRKNNSVVCWGQNDRGQLGNGGTGESLTPSAVLVSNAVEIAVGYDFGCARLSDGHVSCWGANDYGQLGNGGSSAGATAMPANVNGISDAQSITAGVWHACAARTGGGISCWGDNDDGELGNGQKVLDAGAPNGTPGAVSGISNANAMGLVKGFHSCALTKTGFVSCWGENVNGELGENSTVSNEYSPVNVIGYP